MEKKNIYILFIIAIIVNIISFFGLYYIKNFISSTNTELSTSTSNVKLLFSNNKVIGERDFIIDYYYNTKNPNYLYADIYVYDDIKLERKEKITTLKMEQIVNIDKNIPMSLEQELQVIETIKKEGIKIGIVTINKIDYLYTDNYETKEDNAKVIFYDLDTYKKTYWFEYIHNIYFTFDDTTLNNKFSIDKHWYIDNSLLYYYGDINGKTNQSGQMPIYVYSFIDGKQEKKLYNYYSGELEGKKY